MHKWSSRLTGALAGLLLAQAAWADLPHGTLQFITPNVTVGPNDPVQVWARLTLDANSPAFDFSSYPVTGISTADLSPHGFYYDAATSSFVNADFARIDSLFISAYLGCCSTALVASYDVTFPSAGNPNLPGLVDQDHFNLGPGQSFDYKFIQFTPHADGAAAGTYAVNTAQMTLGYTGVDADGHFLIALDRPVIASTCDDLSNASCSFTFTVAVPEPASYALMGLGLAAVGFAARKRTPKA